jgi:WS/DGAT/MGAT family acyltransferase
VVEGLAEVGRAIATPAPATPLNVEVGERRSFRTVYTSLDDIKRVKNAFDVTVNDVMLTIVASGVARLLKARDIDPHEVTLRPVVPVSIRTADQKYQLGNRVVTVRPAVPAAMADPRDHLRTVHREMERLKRSAQPGVVEVLEGVMNWAPPMALGPVARLAFHPRLFNFLVSNIPGPQFPLYLLGRQALDMVACGFLAERQTVAIAAVSYNGKLGFGLLADPDAVPDIDVLADGITRSLRELIQAAERLEPSAVRAAHASPAKPIRGPD